jgi:hypothetical protein
MTSENELAIFTGLDEESRLLFLARYGHELTILARSAYAEEVSDKSARHFLRDINEIQHTLFGYMVSLVTNDRCRFDDEAVVSILLGSEFVRSATNTAFQTALSKSKRLRGD